MDSPSEASGMLNTWLQEFGPSARQRVLIQVSAWAVYVLLFVRLFAVIGRDAAAFSVAPVILAAVLWGASGGVVASILAVPVNAYLFYLTGVPHRALIDFAAILGPGFLGLLIAGTVSGQLRDLSVRLSAALAERLRAERALEASERRFRAMIEKSADAIVLLDPDNSIRYAAPSTLSILGYRPEQLVGRHGLGLVHPEDQAEARSALEYLRRNAASTATATLRVRHWDGGWRWAEFSGINLVADPDVGAIVASFRDISDRKEAEARLKESEARLRESETRLSESETLYRSLIQSVSDVIFSLSPEARFTSLSAAFERVTGFRVEDWIGQSLDDLIHPDDLGRARDTLRRLMFGERQSRVELRLRTRGGDHRTVEISVTPEFRQGQAVGLFGVARDVSLRRQTDEIRQAKEAAEQASRAKSEFLSRMSHELRTPLNAVLGFSQLLEMDNLTESQRESVRHILRAGEHLLGLVNEILDITRVEAGRLKLELGAVPLGEVVHEALDLVAALAANRNVVVESDIQADDSRALRADRQRLKQVLVNLLSNGIKYNRPGGRVLISDTSGGDTIRLLVMDTGPGIPAENLQKLFQPFERLDATRTGVEGTGLGLALSKRLVEAMGGAIGVESTPGEGSTFWVELPGDAQDAEADVSKPEPLLPPPVPRGRADRPLTVLYIEDNQSNLDLVEQILARGAQVRLLAAAEGERGVDLSREARPDLILLDMHLPDIGGEEVLRRLREDAKTSGIPVVVISADLTPGTVERMIGLGARDYLPKPVDVRRLLELVKNTAQARDRAMDLSRWAS